MSCVQVLETFFSVQNKVRMRLIYQLMGTLHRPYVYDISYTASDYPFYIFLPKQQLF